MKEVWNYPFFNISDVSISVGQAVISVFLVGIIFAAYRSILQRISPKTFEGTEISEQESRKLTRLLRVLLLIVVFIGILVTLKLDRVLYKFESFDLSISLIAKAFLFIQIARLLDWFVSTVFIHGYYLRRDQEKVNESQQQDTEQSAKKLVQYIFYIIVILFVIQNFSIDFTIFHRTIGDETYQFKLSNIVNAFLVIMVARLLVWLTTQLFLYTFYKRSQVDVGSQYAVNQLAKYIIYVFAFVICLDVLGIDMNIVLGGAAALLVGVGLGLQQTFNDFISGIVILFERSVSVGDVLEIDGNVGTVKKIGLRASTLETRGSVSVVVPNHLLVNEKVVNWNHENDKVRFSINIGVAYGSDTALVKKLLLKAVEDNPYVVKFPAPFVRFVNFNDSSLDFVLYFFSRNYLVIEDVKSDIRLEVDRLFRANNISIPFPQTEITIKNS